MRDAKNVLLRCVAAALILTPAHAQEHEFAFRVEVVGGVPTRSVGEITPWVVDLPLPVPDFVDVEVEVVLVSRLATCVADPAFCAGSENFVTTNERGFPIVFGCSDAEDNDEDGLIDLEDPNCAGVSSWTFSVAVDDDFGLDSATTNGTLADLTIFPPGIRDLQSGESTNIVDPLGNNGQQGVTSLVILSLSHSHALPPVGNHVILKILGRLSTAGLNAPGDRTAPVGVEVIDPSVPGLVQDGNPWMTRLFLNGEQSGIKPTVLNATVQLRVEPGSPSFLRGDANASGAHELTDGIFIVNHLFLGRGDPTCRDAADTNDDGSIDTSDAIALFEFLFLGGSLPPLPGPGLCGLDATEDELTCESFAVCP